jgi:hypothetical protein
LKNGVRVVVKPTDFKNDEVRMVGFAPGGTSLSSDADYDTARFADTVVGQGGIGPFDATQLRKALAGKVVSVGARISELDEGVAGTASPSDLESMFQLTYLSFTALAAIRPRSTRGARETEMVKNRSLARGHVQRRCSSWGAEPSRRQLSRPRRCRVDLDWHLHSTRIDS